MKRKLQVRDLMTKRNLVTVPLGTTLLEAKDILQQRKIEKLPVVNDNYELVGLITYKDMLKGVNFPNACKDPLGRLVVGAALGVTADRLHTISYGEEKPADPASAEAAWAKNRRAEFKVSAP